MQCLCFSRTSGAKRNGSDSRILEGLDRDAERWENSPPQLMKRYRSNPVFASASVFRLDFVSSASDGLDSKDLHVVKPIERT